MKLKPIFSILMVSMLFSTCEIRIEDNRRLLITGTIQDQNGNPISDINVISGNEDLKLGSRTTDENGEFSLTSLSIDNGEFNEEDEFESDRIREININATESNNNFSLTSSNDNFNRIRIINDQPFRGIEINLGTIILNEISQLALNIDKGNLADQELQVFVEGQILASFSTFCNFRLVDIIDNDELACVNLTPSTRNFDLPSDVDNDSFEFKASSGTSISVSIINAANENVFNEVFDINDNNETIDITL